MSRTPASVWAAVAAARRRLDEGPSRPVVDEPTVSHPSRETVGTPHRLRSTAEIVADLRAVAWDTRLLMADRLLGCEAADRLAATPARRCPECGWCPTCNGYGWTVSIDGATPYLNTVVPCPGCGGEAA